MAVLAFLTFFPYHGAVTIAFSFPIHRKRMPAIQPQNRGFDYVDRTLCCYAHCGEMANILRR